MPDNLFTFTTPVVVAFPILTPNQFMQAVKFREKQAAGGNKQMREPGYELSLLLPPDYPELGDIKTIIRDIAFGNYVAAEVENAPWKPPIKSGDKMADKRAVKQKKADKEPDQEYLRGHSVLVARSKFPPTLGVTVGSKLVELDNDAAIALHERKFFAGAEMLVEVKFAWYAPSPLVPGGGVCAYLQLVMATGGGKPFPGAGRRSVADAFKGYRGRAMAHDPLDDDEGYRGRDKQAAEDDEGYRGRDKQAAEDDDDNPF